MEVVNVHLPCRMSKSYWIRKFSAIPFSADDYTQLGLVFISHKTFLIAGGFLSASAVAANQWFTDVKLGAVKADMARMQADVATMVKDVASVKSDVAEIKKGMEMFLGRVPPQSGGTK